MESVSHIRELTGSGGLVVRVTGSETAHVTGGVELLFLQGTLQSRGTQRARPRLAEQEHEQEVDRKHHQVRQHPHVNLEEEIAPDVWVVSELSDEFHSYSSFS